MDAAEDMQIMCFGDVYVPSTPVKKPLERPVIEERVDSGVDMSITPSLPAPTTTPPPTSIMNTPTSAPNPSTSPCRSNHRSASSSTTSSSSSSTNVKSSIRSFLMPSSFKGKLTQCLVSSAFLGSSLAAYLTFVFTQKITPQLQIIFILLMLAFGIFSLHSIISLFLFCIQQQREPLLPTFTRCENEKNCEFCNQTIDALPRDDSLYAPNDAIRVHLVRDEELKGFKQHSPHVSDYIPRSASQLSLAMPSPPPAYGAWRCSVRADPDLLHWHKVDVTMAAADLAATAEPEYMEDVPLSPSVAEAWKEQDVVTTSQAAVRVSMMGRAKPAVVDIRASGNWSGSGRGSVEV